MILCAAVPLHCIYGNRQTKKKAKETDGQGSVGSKKCVLERMKATTPNEAECTWLPLGGEQDRQTAAQKLVRKWMREY